MVYVLKKKDTILQIIEYAKLEFYYDTVMIEKIIPLFFILHNIDFRS